MATTYRMGRPLIMSQFDEALLDKLDKEAEEIEQHLHGPDSPLLSEDERVALKEALGTRYQRMASLMERVAATPS